MATAKQIEQLERRKKVRELLSDPSTASKSSRALAKLAGCSWWLIEKVRKEMRQRKAAA